MQRNRPNRAFFFYFISSSQLLSQLDFLFPFTPFRRPYQLASPVFVIPRVSSCFSIFSHPYVFLSSSFRLSRSARLSAFFFRETTRPFNRVAFSLARNPPVPYYSAIAPLFQFLRLSSLPLSVSAALYSHPVLPTPTAWRVIPRKPWYFVGHGVQSHGGPDEAWPYLPPTTLLRTDLAIYFTLPYPILSTYPLILNYRMSSWKTHMWESTWDRLKKRFRVALSLRDKISWNKHYTMPLSGPS